MIDDDAMQAGIYAQAYRFFEASNMLAYLFAALLLPIFSRMLKLKESVYELVNFSFKTLMVCALVLSIFCCFFSYDIIDFRYDNYIIESANILWVLMLCFLCVASTYIYGTLLTANGNLFYLNLIAGMGVILNVVLNLILIPKYNALGSAFASLITQFLTGFGQILLCVFIFKFNLLSTFLRLLLFVLGLVLFTYYIKYLAISFYYKFIVYCLFSSIWVLVMRLVKISDFSILIQNRLK
jgi:O-antigen/teichoic acid export membrane protein